MLAAKSTAWIQDRQRKQYEVSKPLASKKVGAYAPVQDLRSPDLLDAADYAIQQMLPVSGEGMNNAKSEGFAYSFLPFTDAYVPRILRASQQVVAGLNWNMTVMILLQEDQDVCIGAFDVTIYNHFGDLSVTQWGSEVECNVAYQIVEEQDEQERTKVYTTPEIEERLREQEAASISRNSTSSFEGVNSSVSEDSEQSESSDEAQITEEHQHQQHAIVGGYSPVKDLGQQDLLAAAKFAYAQLVETTSADNDSGVVPNYSFLPLVVMDSNEEEVGFEFEPRVLEASQQVVAGMNYQMTIMVSRRHNAGDNDCVGAFSVVVYDHFGEYSVTEWGPELPCENASEMLKERAHQEEEAFYSQEEDSSEEEVND